jgi:hypothetical protein
MNHDNPIERKSKQIIKLNGEIKKKLIKKKTK